MTMNNFVILPILISLLTGIFLIFFNKQIKIQKGISIVSTVLNFIIAILLVQSVKTNGILTVQVGSWKPPFGIVLVADMFSALLILTTSLISIACLLYSFKAIGHERENYYYYAFFQFLITGIYGAFLTGDLFNLFVFFEVILMSSYVLLVLGGTKIQFRETLKYILVNIISSALFVIAVGFLFSVTGTLNIADLSLRIAEVEQQGILTVIAILFLIVFGLKGALFPLFFWLPGSYNSPPSVVTAIFGALLTKVGIYAIFRTYTIIFYHKPEITHDFLVVLAGLTIIVGVIGAVSQWDVKKIVIYNIIVAVGVITFGIGVLSPDAIAGSIFYLIHDMIIKATLFLLVGTMIIITGTSNLKEMGGLIKHHPFLGWMFFISAVSLAGIPPLSGFIGKMLLVRGGLSTEHYIVAGLVVMSSLLVFYSVMKIFMNGFWRETKLTQEEEVGSTKGLLFPSAILLSASIMLGLGAEWFYPYVADATEVLLNPDIYIESVLKE